MMCNWECPFYRCGDTGYIVCKLQSHFGFFDGKCQVPQTRINKMKELLGEKQCW